MSERAPAPAPERPAGEAERLAAAFGTLDPAPVRVWSLIATIYGDCVLPRGGELWLGTLTEMLAALGVEPASVRAAVSRLARQGFLARTRTGRTSHYALSPSAVRLSQAAGARIYRRTPAPAPDGWDVALVPRADASLRAALLEDGFAPVAAGAFARPARAARGGVPEGAVRITGTGDDLALARTLYDLEAIAARYRAAIGAADILEAGAAQCAGLAALARRIALVHGFRRAVLRDPGLPAGARPEGFPDREAYRRFAALYRTLDPPTEAWLSRNGRNARGPLPDRADTGRFSDPDDPLV